MWVSVIKESTFQDEHWVSYVTDESLSSTPEAKTTLYVNKLEYKKNSTYKRKQMVFVFL